MIATIFRKEIREFFRDKRFLGIVAILILLLFAASVDGWNRAQSDAQARAAAVASDKEIWLNQGENNPHGAAHFARYAFRPAPALAAFDPGVFDYAGAAFWMEAHNQNPTTLRRAEDTAIQAPFSSVSPAWVIQVIGSLALAVLLFSAIAGERERGTLAALAAIGVAPSRLAFGKAGAVLAVVVGLSCLLIGLSIVPALFGSSGVVQWDRILLLGGIYALALGSFAFLIFWLSARSRTSGSAFVAAAFAWFMLALVWPAMSGQLATSLFPDPDEQVIKNDIQLRANTAFRTGDARENAIAALEAEIVARHGAEDFDSLGFDRGALALQAHEEFANVVYDDLYGELYGLHRKQDAVLRYASVLSPILAAQRLSSALAGTDLRAQQDFATQAEKHRRRMIAALNEDMMVNGGELGFAYRADRSLWETIDDFRPSSPGLGDILSAYWVEWSALLVWLVAMIGLSLNAAKRAVGREVR